MLAFKLTRKDEGTIGQLDSLADAAIVAQARGKGTKIIGNYLGRGRGGRVLYTTTGEEPSAKNVWLACRQRQREIYNEMQEEHI